MTRLLQLGDLRLDATVTGVAGLDPALVEPVRDAAASTLDAVVDAAVSARVSAVLIVGEPFTRSGGDTRARAHRCRVSTRLAAEGIPTLIVGHGAPTDTWVERVWNDPAVHLGSETAHRVEGEPDLVVTVGPDPGREGRLNAVIDIADSSAHRYRATAGRDQHTIRRQQPGGWTVDAGVATPHQLNQTGPHGAVLIEATADSFVEPRLLPLARLRYESIEATVDEDLETVLPERLAARLSDTADAHTGQPVVIARPVLTGSRVPGGSPTSTELEATLTKLRTRGRANTTHWLRWSDRTQLDPASQHGAVPARLWPALAAARRPADTAPELPPQIPTAIARIVAGTRDLDSRRVAALRRSAEILATSG